MDRLKEAFLSRMATDGIERSFCPYRVCPIGAHVDHQYGLVTGFAIDKGIEILYVPQEDGGIRMQSMNLPGSVNFSVFDIPEKKCGDWGDYLRGAVVALKRNHRLTRGIKGLVNGSLPIGGLSSSAALTISFLSAICKVNSVQLPELEIIMTALAAENEYVGVNCGKLDQSCEVYSKKDCLLYLDNLDDSHELIPKSPDMKPFEIAIFFSGVERTLVGSKFNMRVDELKSAAYALKAFAGIEYGKFSDTRLRDVPVEVFEQYRDRLPENWRRRAEHYYTETERVRKGAEAWRRGDIEAYGKLSFESGRSSIYKYETGSDELKALYEIMLETDGIYGGRFSGAGFKGCCMALIDPAFEEQIREQVTKKYLSRFPALEGKYEVCFCSTSDGCRFGI